MRLTHVAIFRQSSVCKHQIHLQSRADHQSNTYNWGCVATVNSYNMGSALGRTLTIGGVYEILFYPVISTSDT